MISRDYVAKTVGEGVTVGVTVYWANASASGSRPVALVFHGGAFVVGTRLMISQQHIADLLELGFVVVSTDYSLCPQVSLYAGPEQDAKDVYKWTKEALPDLLAAEGVTIEPERKGTVAIGYSAGGTLALGLGAESNPPAAIVAFYAPELFRDSFWSSPLPALASIPEFDEAFLNKIHEEPLKTFTGLFLERAAASATASASPSAATGAKTQTSPAPKHGLPKSDLSVPRNAWLFDSLKRGTQIRQIVQDGDLDRVDPATGFSPRFPPTFFLHGTADDWVVPRLSEEAHAKLAALGVETELRLLPGLAHGFDASLPRDDPRYAAVTEAFKFLKNHVTCLS